MDDVEEQFPPAITALDPGRAASPHAPNAVALKASLRIRTH